MHSDAEADPPRLVFLVGSTTLSYHLRSIQDLHQMLIKVHDWVPLGSADENKPTQPGTVEDWGRAADNPIGS